MSDNKEQTIVDECEFKTGTLFELEYLFRSKLKELDERVKIIEDGI